MGQRILQAIIVIATAVTATVHLVLGAGSLSGADTRFGAMFIFNGLGYLALLAALFLDIRFFADRRPLVLWVFAVYTTLTFVLYFVFNGFTFGAAAIAAKLAELLLGVSLLLYMPHRRWAD